MPTISVIVPVYNTEKYLRRCIDSILAQTFTDFELLLINDGSTDKSGVICDEYAFRDSRIRVFHKKNGGVSSARNLGLDNAKGEWISFVDADDYLNDDFLSILSHNLDVDLIIASYVEYYEGTVKDNQCGLPDVKISSYSDKKNLFFQYMHTGFLKCIWGKLYRKRIIKAIRFDTNMRFGEDTLFMLDILLKVNSVRLISKSVYIYRTFSIIGKYKLKIEESKYAMEKMYGAYDRLNFYNPIFEKDIFCDYKSSCQKEIYNNPAKWYDDSFLSDVYKRVKKHLTREYRMRYKLLSVLPPSVCKVFSSKSDEDNEKDDRNYGLSGLMRVKNEERLIESCIDSCIEALDELIILCNDCTDGTLEILERKQKQYPDKLRVYLYNHDVLSFNLTKEEFEEAINLPDDSVRLYANMCNYGLSQVKYKYVTKIDTDQLYFAKELKKWRDICANPDSVKWNFCMVWGWFFMMYLSLYRRTSARLGKPCLFLIPKWLVTIFYESYQKYATWQLAKGKVAIALSGINVFKDGDWFITFDNINGHPPYNGTGDTVIFRLSEKTYFTRQISRKYSSVTECFTQPYKVVFTSPIWFHQHANRIQCFDKIKKVKDECPEQFVPISDFFKMSYKEVHNKLDLKVHPLFQRILFAFIHKCKKHVIEDNLSVLEKLGVK